MENIYNVDGRITASLRRLHNSNITNENKKIILDFWEDLKLEGIGKHQQNIYLMRLVKIGILGKMNFSDMNKRRK